MLHTGVDETLFVQILQAYGARNPSELIPDAAYDATLKALTGNAHNTTELQHRFGAKLFLAHGPDGQSILVAGTKKRNLELIPLRHVHATLTQLAHTYHDNATQLKQAVKGKVLGIPEEIVQEYCDMAVSVVPQDEAQPLKEEDFKKCCCCGSMKSNKTSRHQEKAMGLRSRCRACESKGHIEIKNDDEDVDDGLRRKKKKESYIGLTGTAICAACGERKPVFEFDKARQKPFTLKCRTCSEINAPLKSKLCCSCLLELPLDRFYRDSYTKAGFRPRCMECMKGRRGHQSLNASPIETDQGMDESFEPTSVRKPRRKKRRKQRRKIGARELTLHDLDLDHPSKIVPRRDGTAAEEAAVKLEESADGPAVETGRHRKGLTGCTTMRDEDGNITKYCTGCLVFKDTSEFGRDVSKPSGLRSRCRQCHRRPSKLTVTDGMQVTSTKTPRKPCKKRTPIYEKTCIRCHEEKSIAEFYRDKSKDDSYAAICKKCARQAKHKDRRTEKCNNGFEKLSRGHVDDMDEAEMDVVMNYIDALLPESSENSGGVDMERPIEETTSALHRSCIGCHIDKSWIEFDANPMLPDGLCPLCKECRRGYGMRGRRLIGRKLKRCCVRCGQPKTADAFTRSIFYPNRTSRICWTCRDEDVPSSKHKRRRLDGTRQDVLDLIDFDCDLLKIRDPGGGERLWKTCESESASEGPTTATSRPFRAPDTELQSHSPNTVTITHRVPVKCPMQSEMPSMMHSGIPSSSLKLPYVTEKQCSRCGEMKTRDRFYVDETRSSRLDLMCIDCLEASH